MAGRSARVQSGRLIDLGNVRVIGMSMDEAQRMFKLRFDDAGRKVWMLPEDVTNQTINAFNVSATAASGYGGAAPTGKYFAPANGPDCIEVDNGANYGDCAEGSIVLTDPLFQQYDMRLAKKTKRFGVLAEQLEANGDAVLTTPLLPGLELRLVPLFL